MIKGDVSNLTKGSHKICQVFCDFQKSAKCKISFDRLYKDILYHRKNNNGKDICLQCSRFIKNSGRNNPNTKYSNLDDNFFNIINTREKAYLLGWIASDGTISKRGFAIQIKNTDLKTLDILKNIICKEIPIKNKNNMIELVVNSQQISKDLCRHLKINPGKKSNTVQFPDINNFMSYFLRGYFEGDGYVSKSKRIRATISSSSNFVIQSINSIVPGGCIVYNCIEYNNHHAINFLNYIYKDIEINNENLFLQRKYQKYLYWLKYIDNLPEKKKIKYTNYERN